MNAISHKGGLRAADGNENGHETPIPTPIVVLLEVPDIAAHLIEIGGFRFDTVLEFDNQDGAVFQNDQIRAASATSMKLEFENDTEARRGGHRALESISECRKAPVPRVKLWATLLNDKTGKAGEEIFL
jgi:hypothetical protein